ncbi:MAG: hypothetical protein Q7R42_03760 [Candidatus Planktophila sp.]|nr:hypothetical protein [Candidatus Planktophila sp.]
MKYSVSIAAEGDRVIALEEVVELADAVAPFSGVASGAATQSYGVQILVEAENLDSAIDMAMQIFSKAVVTAKLPVWPITRAEAMNEDDDWDDFDE